MVNRIPVNATRTQNHADSGAILHYVFDPFCGWCYAAAPLLDVAQQLATAHKSEQSNGQSSSTFHIQLHAGGMMMGANRQRVTAALRDYVLPHDARIAQLTGQVFSPAYRDGLLRDERAVFDSAPPITAILLAEQMRGAGLTLLKRLQHAHYVEGRRIAEHDVLSACAAELGISAAEFAAGWQAQVGPATEQHVARSRQLLQQVGSRGFPTLIWQDSEHWSVLPWHDYLGAPDAWRARLQHALSSAEPASPVDMPSCNIDGACH